MPISFEGMNAEQQDALFKRIMSDDYEINPPDMVITHEGRKMPSQEEIQEATLLLGKSYEEIIEFMDAWVDIPINYKKLIAVWIIGTYFHKQFSAFPYLFLNAMRGSGKTRLLSIISWLQYHGTGEVLTNPSDAVMFRTAREKGLVLDEFESEKSKDKQTMREYLNACYKKGGVVYRMEKQKNKEGKEQQVAVPFPLYTPICMANINGIEDVLGDRALSLILEKSMNPSLVKKIENFPTSLVIARIKKTLEDISVRMCDVWRFQQGIEEWNFYINNKYPYITTHTTHTTQPHTTIHNLDIGLLEFFNKIDETGIFGRNLELLFPLLLISKTIGDSIFLEFLEIAKGLNQTKKEEEFAESKDVILFEFVSKAEKYRFEYVFTHELFQEYKSFMGNLIDADDRGFNVVWFGLALKRLKLVHDRKRVSKGVMLLLDVDKAKEKLKIFKVEEKKEDNNI